MFFSLFFSFIFLAGVASLCALKIGKESLIALIAVEAVLIHLMITNKLDIFGLRSEVSEALLVGVGLGLNLVHEYFGEEAVKKSIKTSTLCALLFSIAFYLHATYGEISSSCLIDFKEITPRLLAASCISFFIGQNIEAYLYTFLLEQKSLEKQFILRNYIVTIIGQFLDTCLFTIGAWYGLHGNIMSMILYGCALKFLVILCATPFLTLSKYILRPHASI